MELSFEQKLQIQKLDMQIAALPLDKQQQFARGQRELVPKYLAKNAASGLNTTTTLTVVCFDIRIDHSFVFAFVSSRILEQKFFLVLHQLRQAISIRMPSNLYVYQVLICM